MNNQVGNLLDKQRTIEIQETKPKNRQLCGTGTFLQAAFMVGSQHWVKAWGIRESGRNSALMNIWTLCPFLTTCIPLIVLLW